jgi:hypothetical protein
MVSAQRRRLTVASSFKTYAKEKMSIHTGASCNLFVDSSKRVSGTSSDFLFEIPQLLGSLYDSVVVRQISVPKSWYLLAPGSSFTVLQGAREYPLQLTGEITRSDVFSIV